MKTNKLFSLLAIFAAVFTFSCTNGGGGDGDSEDGGVVGGSSSSGNNDSSLNGTWAFVDEEECEECYVQLNNGSAEFSVAGILMTKGTYSTNNDKITMTITHVHGTYFQLTFDIIFAEYGIPSISIFEPKWYTKEEAKAQMVSVLGEELAEDEEFDNSLDEMFVTTIDTYSISNNTLTLTDEDGEVEIYTK